LSSPEGGDGTEGMIFVYRQVRSLLNKKFLEENEMKKLMLIVSVIIAASMLLVACQTATTPGATEVTPVTTEAPKHTGAIVDEVDFTAIADPEPAVAQIQAGAIDIYPVTIGDAKVFATVKADPNLKYVTTSGSFDQFLFNVVACKDANMLNPFTDMQIREAMQWAVDRDFIVQEFFGGLAVPLYTLINTYLPDYARYAATIGGEAAKYAYNLPKAQAVVDTRMVALGATKDAATGKWMYKGKPVTLIGLIRTEDARKDQGIYFAGQLEKLGFTVTQALKVRKEAGPIWTGANPENCAWNYYTAGWISTAISRDLGSQFAGYDTGAGGNPYAVFLAMTPSAAYQDLVTKLQTNSFSSMAERDTMFKQAIVDSDTEAWHGVMTVDVLAFEPYSDKISVAYDLAAAIGGTSFWPFTLQIKGQTGGTVKIAQSGVLVQPWNPINGSNWIDDAMPQKGTEDYGVVADPYTGLSRPERIESATLDALTGLPIRTSLPWVTLNFVDKITVPGDAWYSWDAKTQKFITVAEAFPNGLEAKTKGTVVYPKDLFQTKWHDGSNLSVADFVMFMIMNWDPATKESKIYDEALAPTLEAFVSHFKGVQITSTDPLTIVTYDDLFALDAENSITTWYPTGLYSYPYGTAPWDVMALAAQGEESGQMAFGQDKATAIKAEWTNLVSGPSLAILKTFMDQDAVSGYIPYAPTMSQYVTAADATARYASLQAWYAAHNHFWVGTGAFYLDKVFPVEGTIVLKRFADFPDPSDKWASLGTPAIAEAAVDGPATVTVGQQAVFNVTITFQGAPYKNSDLAGVSYIVKDATGAIALSGDAAAVSDGSYTITLTADQTKLLVAGSNTLTAAVSSNLVALPTFAAIQFVTVAP